MEEKNPMPIRKFSLIGIIALGLIIFSKVLVLFSFNGEILENIRTYVVLISQILGNVFFGVALIGYFMHLRENKILKWTSLFIGIFYILNFFSVDNFFALFSDDFGLVEYFSSSTPFVIYASLKGIAMIFFGYAFSKLGQVNKLIGILAVVFIASSVYVFTADLITVQIANILENFDVVFSDKMVNDISIKTDICNVLSDLTLLAIFIALFINQKGAYTKTFKVKVENIISDEA